MLRTSQEPKTLSDKEVDADIAEGRKKTAEAELVSIGEVRKQLESDLLSLKNEIKTDRVTLEQGKEEIHKLNEEILKVQSLLKTEQQSFDEFTTSCQTTVKQLQQEIDDMLDESKSLNLDILTFSQQHETNKAEKLEEIKDLETEKNRVVENVKTLTKEKEAIVLEISTLENKFNNIKTEVYSLQETKNQLESNNMSLSREIDEQKGIIQNNKDFIANQVSIISTKEDEIKTLDLHIEQKNLEYKDLEKKAFSILNREDLLDQREQFIKSQYERAGIKWE